MALVSVEVIDAVQRTLEKEGLLQSIRAQLRSNVMKILTSDLSKNTVHPNVEFANTENGRIVLCLVRDLLEHLNYKQSLSVFDAESSVDSFYDREIKHTCDALHLQTTSKVSLLEQLVDDRLHQKPIQHTEEQRPTTQQFHTTRDTQHHNPSAVLSPRHTGRSASQSPPLSPSSPLLQPFQRVIGSNKSDAKTVFDDDSFDSSYRPEEGREDKSLPYTQPQPAKKSATELAEKTTSRTSGGSGYGALRDDLDQLVESMSPAKPHENASFEDEKEDTQENTHAAAPYAEAKISSPLSSPTQGRFKTHKPEPAEESMLEEIEEIAESFEHDEEEEEDEYDFDAQPAKKTISSLRSSSFDRDFKAASSSSSASAQREQPALRGKGSQYFASDRDSSDEDDDLPAYGYTAAPAAIVGEKDEDSRREEEESSQQELEYKHEKEQEEESFVLARSDADETEQSFADSEREIEKKETERAAPTTTSSLPQLRLGGRLPFNSSDFLTNSNGSVPDPRLPSSDDEQRGNATQPAQTRSESKRNDDEVDGSFAEEIEEEEEEEELSRRSAGPEYDSEGEDELLGSFSQLDHHFRDKDDDKGKDKLALAASGEHAVQESKSQRVEVKAATTAHSDDEHESKEDQNELDQPRAVVNRATVSRVSQGSSMRSIKGWDVHEQDVRYDDVYDAADDEVDQFTSSPLARIAMPGRRATDARREDEDDLSLEESHLDEHLSAHSHHDEDEDEEGDERHNALQSSYRSNQEEDEIVIEHDAEEDEYDQFEDDFVDPDVSQIEPPPPLKSSSLFQRQGQAQHAFDSHSDTEEEHEETNQRRSHSHSHREDKPEEDEDEEYGDEYGEDDFEDVDQDKSRETAQPARLLSQQQQQKPAVPVQPEDDDDSVEEEEINSEIEEEDGNFDGMSVGGHSESDDDQGWGKAKPSAEPAASSIFKQRSGVLPTMNNTSTSGAQSRFAPLNDFSDEDEDDGDDGLGAFSSNYSRSNSGKNPAPTARTAESKFEESDEGVLLSQRSQFNRGSGGSASRGRYGDESEENSVMSGNLSVGGDNSGEESFSMND